MREWRCYVHSRVRARRACPSHLSSPDPSENATAEISSTLVADVRALVNAARHRAAQAINAELVLLYWSIGNRIRRDILGDERAGYGEQIVSTLSRQLTSDYGAGFSRPNLFHMIRFVDVWPDRTQVEILAPQLGWSHFKELLYLENEIQRSSMQKCVASSVGRCALFESEFVRHALRAHSNFAETGRGRNAKRFKNCANWTDSRRTSFSAIPTCWISQVLKDTFSERDLETAILRELEGSVANGKSRTWSAIRFRPVLRSDAEESMDELTLAPAHHPSPARGSVLCELHALPRSLRWFSRLLPPTEIRGWRRFAS